MNYKRMLCSVLASLMLLDLCVFAAFDAENNSVARVTVHPISPGLEYISSVEVCDGIRQEIHKFTYTPNSETEIVPAYGQYIYGFNSVGKLVSSYDGEGRLVGGINTDFFITSTGIPLSCFISNGEIISSCDNRAAIGFDKNGNAVIGYPEISASLVNDNFDFKIAHINKTPAVWGLYLVTDKFAATTKTSTDSIEIVLKSFNKEATESAIEDYLDGKVIDDITDTTEDSTIFEDELNVDFETDEETSVSEVENEEEVDDTEASDFSDDTELLTAISSEEDSSGDEQEVNDSEDYFEDLGEKFEEYPFDESVEEENTTVEDNEEKSVESDEEISSEKDETEDDVSADEESENNEDEIFGEDNVEEGINVETDNDIENLSKKIPLDVYELTEDYLPLSGSIDVVVTEIRDGVKNGAVPKNSFVLCVPKVQYGHLVSGVSVGDTFVLNTECGEEFSECISIFGAGSIILKEGEAVKQENDSIFYYRNPRTAAGIKEDGSVIFVCVDGRRQGESHGYTISELTDYLISLGCVNAVNFDGGGSTTFYAADIGDTVPVLKNVPSEGSERRVANGMLFVNKSEPSDERRFASLYPNYFLTFNKGAVTDISGKILFADSNGHPIAIGENVSVSIFVNDYFGFTHNNIFVPNGNAGKAEIIAKIGTEEELYYVGTVEIADTVDEINLTATDTDLTPFEYSTELYVSPRLLTMPINYTNYSIDFEIYAESTNEDGETEYIEQGEEEAFLYINDSTIAFVPSARGRKYIIVASMGDYSETAEIFVEKHPFDDMTNHWASETSYEMFKSGLILGELSGDGMRSFMPQRNMTRAEFCTVLARILKLDTTLYQKHIDEGANRLIENEVGNEVEEESDDSYEENIFTDEEIETMADELSVDEITEDIIDAEYETESEKLLPEVDEESFSDSENVESEDLSEKDFIDLDEAIVYTEVKDTKYEIDTSVVVQEELHVTDDPLDEAIDEISEEILVESDDKLLDEEVFSEEIEAENIVETPDDYEETYEKDSSEVGDGEADSETENGEIELINYDLSDVPEWARGYVYALFLEGYLDTLLFETEDGGYSIGAEDFITRMDVIRLFGSLLDGESNSEISAKFSDYTPDNDEDLLYFSRIVENGIIGGYEDGTVRPFGTLTRAEAAMVFSRFIAKFE